MDSSDKNHEEAARIWRLCLDEEACIRTSNYVIIETTALLQSRLGMNAAALWNRDVLGVVEILWVDQPTHSIARDLWLGMGRTSVSLVDCVGFTSCDTMGWKRSLLLTPISLNRDSNSCQSRAPISLQSLSLPGCIPKVTGFRE